MEHAVTVTRKAARGAESVRYLPLPGGGIESPQPASCEWIERKNNESEI